MTRDKDGPEAPESGSAENASDTVGSARKLSRRDLLKGAGLAGAAAILPSSLGAEATAPAASSRAAEEAAAGAAPSAARALPVVQAHSRLQNLTVREGQTLDAMIARIIPADENGPGAREAGALHFIDNGLGGSMEGDLQAYRNGLAALDRYSQFTRGARFVDLSERDQDSVLIDVQGGSAGGAGAGFSGSSGSFFNMVRGDVIQGTFSDPRYGGNRDFVGWDMIRYPGVRRIVSANNQRQMESGQLPGNHISAYEM